MTRRMKRFGSWTLLLSALVVLGALPQAGHAQDASLTGTWEVEIDSPEGVFQMTWTIEQHEDGTLTGKSMADMIGEVDIGDGWVDGDTFGFSMYVEAQGEAFDVLYEGNFTTDEVFGSVDVGGGMFSADFTGVRGDGGVR